MEDSELSVIISNLQDGAIHPLSVDGDPSFMQVADGEAVFSHAVCVRGKAYLAGDEGIVLLSCSTQVELPCRICNDRVVENLSVEELYFACPLSDCKNGVINFSEVVREALLLELPQVTECGGGTCPQRQEMLQYYSSGEASVDQKSETYQPFADLDLSALTGEER